MVPDPPSQDEATTTRRPGWPLLHGAGDHTAGASDDAVAETGTTIVGVTAAERVVLAADRRASVGGGRFVTGKRVRKVEPVHPAAVGLHRLRHHPALGASDAKGRRPRQAQLQDSWRGW